MLRTSARAAGRAACAACSRAEARTVHRACTAARSPRTPATSQTSTGHPSRLSVYTRGAATYAQGRDEVEPQLAHDAEAHDETEQPATQRGELAEATAKDAEQALADLLGEIAADAAARPPAASDAPLPSSASSTADDPPSPPAEAAHEDTLDTRAAAPVKPSMSLNALLEPASSSTGPTADDLNAFRPRRFNVPTATSPDSHRLIYLQVWEKTYKRVDRAFNKRQLEELVSQYGLALDLTDPRLRTNTPGKKAKFWKSKRVDQMSKRELLHTILVLHFNMVHPETVPKRKTGPSITEAVALSDRDLFLLLSPKSATIPRITRQLGVEVMFRRNPATGVVSLLIHGSKEGVQAAKEQLELLDHSTAKTFELPAPATTLRPEVYQAISRTAKAFLEPGPEPNTLKATAVEEAMLHRTERLLNSAFAAHAERTSTGLFASIPSNLDSIRYAMYPFTPLSPPPSIQAGGTSHFARVKTLSLLSPSGSTPAPSSPSSSEQSADAAQRAQAELLDWSERMRLERTERLALYLPAAARTTSGGASASSPWKVLRAPFADDEHVTVQARFGHVVWPLYRSRGDAGAAQPEMGPALAGAWPFGRFVEWVAGTAKKVRSIFLPSPPNDLLQSTRILTPLPASSSDSSTFASLLSPLTDRDAFAQDAELASARQAEALAGPALESTVLRRWTYRVQGAAEEQAQPRLEVEFELDNVEADPSVREMRIRGTELRVVRESRVDLMMPTGAQDAQFTMASTTLVPPEEHPAGLDERTMSFHGPPRITLEHGGTPYMLDTDHLIRRTILTPPAASPGAPAPLETVQESWTSLAKDAARGTDVSVRVGAGAVAQLRKSDEWRRGVEEVEKRCLGRRTKADGERVGGELAKLVLGRR